MKSHMKIRGNFRSILVILPAAIIILFAFLVILPVVPASTYAEDDTTNEGIVITISPEINASLLSSEDGDYKIVKDVVTIGTDALNGYTLYISTDTTQHQTLYLNGDTSNENRINGVNGTYESPKTLGNYEWGFAVPGVSHFDDSYNAENPDENSKFAILPTENKIIRDYTTSTSGDTAEVYYGFKLGGTIEPGEYKTTITYTAVPANQPLTAKAILGNNGNLNFVYDRNVYAVGETYMDNIGETEIGTIYNVPVNSSSYSGPGWANNDNVRTANFESSFYGFKPTSTLGWFMGDKYLSTVTNPENLNTKTVTNMSRMFLNAGRNAATWSVDLSSWNTSNVTNISSMFANAGYGATAWNVDISDWDTGSVTNMESLFNSAGYSAATWTVDLSNWDTSNVTNMSHVFNSAGYSAATWATGDIGSWKTSNATNMWNMFRYAGYNATTWDIDLSDWNTGHVTNMEGMFDSAGRNSATWAINLAGWDTSSVTNMKNMFLAAGYNATTWTADLSGWTTGSVTSMESMFLNAGHNATIWTIEGLSGWNTGSVVNMNNMFNSAGYNATTWIIDLSSWNTSSAVYMNYVFYYAGRHATTWSVGNLNFVDEEHRGWNIDNVTTHTDFVDWGQENIRTSELPWQSN